MKARLPILICCTVLLLCNASLVMGQQARQIAVPLSVSGTLFGYYAYTPVEYDTASKFPLMIFLHGSDERGEGNDSLYKVKKNGPPKLINANTKYPFIVISPQTSGEWQRSRDLNVFIDHLIKKYKVDLKRIYLTGLSLGSFGVWDFAFAHPDRLAAIVPISGNKELTSLACANKSLNVWAFHDSPDPSPAQTSQTKNMMNALFNCPPPKGEHIMTLYTHTGIGTHSAWNQAYSPAPLNYPYAVTTPANVLPSNTSIVGWLASKSRSSVSPMVIAESNKKTEYSTTLTVTATSLDAGGSVASYAWTVESKPAAGASPVLTGVNTATLSISGMSKGDYFFKVVATDSDGDTENDVVKVSANLKPIAIAGPDQYISTATSGVILDGSASYDPDGTFTGYTWTKISGPPGVTPAMSATNVSIITVTGFTKIGTYKYQLTVKDDFAWQIKDQVSIIVSNDAPVNQAPTANAGTDQVITLPGNSVVLNGSSSTDPENGALTYAWVKLSGGNATFANSNVAVVTVSGLEEGTYSFQLTVNDNGALSSTDVVTVTVVSLPLITNKIIQVNFRGNPPALTDPAWNDWNVKPLSTGLTKSFNYTDGSPSGIIATITSVFNGVNTLGMTVPGIYPAEVNQGGWYLSDKIGKITLGGLDAASTYSFSFFGSRTDPEGSTVNRMSNYSIDGYSFGSANARSNLYNTVDLYNIVTDSGNVVISVQKGTGSSYAYLNAMVITVTSTIQSGRLGTLTEGAQGFAIAGIYPNPTEKDLFVTFTALLDENVSVEIISLNGTIVSNTIESLKGSDILKITLANSLPDGLYVLVVKSSQGVFVKKFQKR